MDRTTVCFDSCELKLCIFISSPEPKADWCVGIRRRQHFQTSSPQKPQGQSKSNFMYSFYWSKQKFFHMKNLICSRFGELQQLDININIYLHHMNKNILHLYKTRKTGLSPQYFNTDRSKAVLLLWFLTVTCSCCPYLYFGSAITQVTYFSKF